MRKSLWVKRGKTNASNLHIKWSTVVISLFIHQIPGAAILGGHVEFIGVAIHKQTATI
jgi:hypothetical protein